MFEAGLEFHEGVVRPGESKPLTVLPERIDLHELFGDLPDRFLGLLLDHIPGAAPELIQLRFLLIRPDVFLQDADAIRRDVEAVIARVFNDHKVIDFQIDLHLGKAAVAADAVIFMDNQISGRELTEACPVDLAHARLGFDQGPLWTKDFIFTDDVEAELRPRETFGQASQTYGQPLS